MVVNDISTTELSELSTELSESIHQFSSIYPLVYNNDLYTPQSVLFRPTRSYAQAVAQSMEDKQAD